MRIACVFCLAEKNIALQIFLLFFCNLLKLRLSNGVKQY